MLGGGSRAKYWLQVDVEALSRERIGLCACVCVCVCATHVCEARGAVVCVRGAAMNSMR